MKKDYDQHVWQNSISFFLDGVSFIHKYNPLDQARAPKGRIWRKPREGLSYGCTAKGAHCGSGGRVAKFMVAVSYGKGVILCEQYETLNRKTWSPSKINNTRGTPTVPGTSTSKERGRSVHG